MASCQVSDQVNCTATASTVDTLHAKAYGFNPSKVLLDPYALAVTGRVLHLQRASATPPLSPVGERCIVSSQGSIRSPAARGSPALSAAGPPFSTACSFLTSVPFFRNSGQCRASRSSTSQAPAPSSHATVSRNVLSSIAWSGSRRLSLKTARSPACISVEFPSVSSLSLPSSS